MYVNICRLHVSYLSHDIMQKCLTEVHRQQQGKSCTFIFSVSLDKKGGQHSTPYGAKLLTLTLHSLSCVWMFQTMCFDPYLRLML